MKVSTRTQLDPVRILSTLRERYAAPLTRGAADVRQTARRLIRRGRISRPGEPPRSHTDILRRLIVYAYDRDSRRAIVGPLPALRNYPNGDRKPIGATVPSVLEFGGRINVRQMLLRRGWVRETAARVSRYPAAARRMISARIEPRPYMRPAIEQTAARLVEHFRNAFNT